MYGMVSSFYYDCIKSRQLRVEQNAPLVAQAINDLLTWLSIMASACFWTSSHRFETEEFSLPPILYCIGEV